MGTIADQAAATIAALRAEIERAKLEGVRAGIEASAMCANSRRLPASFARDVRSQTHNDAIDDVTRNIRALDAAAIARGDSALSDLIAGDADLYATVADSDGDDGA